MEMKIIELKIEIHKIERKKKKPTLTNLFIQTVTMAILFYLITFASANVVSWLWLQPFAKVTHQQQQHEFEEEEEEKENKS